MSYRRETIMRITQLSGFTLDGDDDARLPLKALRALGPEHRPCVRWYADYRSHTNQHALMVWDDDTGQYVPAGYARTFDEAQSMYARMERERATP
jgi:hypothetical protein